MSWSSVGSWGLLSSLSNKHHSRWKSVWHNSGWNVHGQGGAIRFSCCCVESRSLAQFTLAFGCGFSTPIPASVLVWTSLSRSAAFLCELHSGSSLRRRCFTLCESPSAENWRTNAAEIMSLLPGLLTSCLTVGTIYYQKPDILDKTSVIFPVVFVAIQPRCARTWCFSKHIFLCPQITKPLLKILNINPKET